MTTFLRASFPIRSIPKKVQPGLCMDGTKKLGIILASQGLKVKYCYYPADKVQQGHMWVLVQNPKGPGWMAIDPCTEQITDRHYNPPITLDRFEDVWKHIPQIEV